jgi:RimJ/RimL family protein N-acetyltransferase
MDDLLPIAGPGVVIDRLVPGDAAALSVSHSHEGNARYQGWTSPLSPAEAAAFIDEMAEVALLSADGVQLALREERGGDLVGDVYLVRSSIEPAVVEVGITLVPDAHGRGLATAAIQALLAALFSERRHGVQRVDAHLDEANERSGALFERLGFLPLARREGASQRRDGMVADELHYAMERATWLALHR